MVLVPADQFTNLSFEAGEIDHPHGVDEEIDIAVLTVLTAGSLGHVPPNVGRMTEENSSRRAPGSSFRGDDRPRGMVGEPIPTGRRGESPRVKAGSETL